MRMKSVVYFGVKIISVGAKKDTIGLIIFESTNNSWSKAKLSQFFTNQEVKNNLNVMLSIFSPWFKKK